ncbi:MAG: hypothetical protein ACRESE_09715 [Gammaproteobacteria bacterium]
MAEKDIENGLYEILLGGSTSSSVLDNLLLRNTNTNIRNLSDLIQSKPYEIIKDNSRWNLFPNLMTDIIGGMTPDIVLRSNLSGQNRIIIEVKETDSIHHDIESSQIIRYFLHLLRGALNN